jgi:tryptophan synthase alpha chain
MSKRLNDIIKDKKGKGEKLLSIFVTAGFPEIDSTKEIILSLDEAGVDFIELGIPFSDPIADGPVIQKSSDRAIQNGVNLKTVFHFMKEVRQSSQIPIILMGYLNPINKMGIDRFIAKASESSVDGLIIPDWAMEENQNYSDSLKKHDLDIIHLIAPNTPPDRIELINRVSTSFIYCVAYTGVTGQDNNPTEKTSDFLRTIRDEFNHPSMIGFGIKNRDDYLTYTNYADGVIIGSAFIQLLEQTARENRKEAINTFIRNIRGNSKL